MKPIFVLALLVGCGSDKDSSAEVEVNDVEAACTDLCALSAAGDGCDYDAVMAECASLCGLIVFGLPENCTDLYLAAVECESGLDYVCDGSNGGDFPHALDNTCVEEALALEECLSF